MEQLACMLLRLCPGLVALMKSEDSHQLILASFDSEQHLATSHQRHLVRAQAIRSEVGVSKDASNVIQSYTRVQFS